MAASDSTYRSVKTLHIVFAVSSIVMLLTIVAMFADDYFRGWKVEQRLFYDVEEEMAKRAMLSVAPSEERVEQIAKLEAELKDKKEKLASARAEMERGLGDLPNRKLRTENEFASVKADYDSIMSFYNGATEQHGAESPEAEKFRTQLDGLAQKMTELKSKVEVNQAEYDQKAREAGLPDKEAEIALIERTLKQDLADFDRFLKLAAQKRWSSAETIRTLPILEGFASPTRINQYTLTELPIDYSFKHVTRYDRCTTCHMGMEKAAFDTNSLAKLTENPETSMMRQFRGAKRLLEERTKAGIPDLPDPADIMPQKIDFGSEAWQRAARVKQFAAHPRLDLFVDANSPHSAERFGCTICHSGQGSATAFYEASHSPNNSLQKREWFENYHWKSNHYWDYPMQPHRFVESSCVKCHHEVTDLVRYGNQDEAPKLTKGYKIVSELGCFGCHEISGFKAGKRVGPDLRLEPEPSLDSLSPSERAAKEQDPAYNGTMRKVGPNLARLSEKTNEEWVRRWLKSPRGFRENTKMPHFYLQPNNHPDALPAEQKAFPDNEIHAISHYLLMKSQGFVTNLAQVHGEKPEVAQGDAALIEQLKKRQGELTKQIADPKTTEPGTLRDELARVEKDLKDAELRVKKRAELKMLGAPASLLTLSGQGDVNRGRMLFQERGCMACHSHEGTEKPGSPVDNKTIPAMIGDATFGPDLSRVALKITPQNGKPEDGHKWLVAWLLNPMAHNPRTLMPDTQLTPEQASDIAAWLLSQKPEWKPAEGEDVPPADIKALKDLAAVHLRKVLSIGEVRDALETKNGFTAGRLREIAGKNPEADELELGGDLSSKKDDELVPVDEHKLKMYVGKKAIGNLGCYACHTIPGFQSAKPIGAALNEWGKKEVERLAYEDAHNFVHHHFNIVPTRNDPKDPKKVSDQFRVTKDEHGHAKKPYEQFFSDMLDHHGRTREGFLHLKLEEPRSYDYARIRNWEDRLRMPQFKFARPRKLPGETREQYEARTIAEEAEAREAVMTFILGLVAESIPSRYVHAPTGDKLHEVKGRQVLEKFNCASCHIVRPGSTEFNLNQVAGRLEQLPAGVLFKHDPGVPFGGDDYRFPEHIAWAGREQPNNERARLAGVKPPIEVKFDEDDEEPSPNQRYWLMQALRFHQGGSKDAPARDVLAGATVSLPPDVIHRATPQYGGYFMEQLVQYLQRKDRENFGGQGKFSNAYAAAPPSLIGEGEKVQPDWLYRFLKNPHSIRPLTVLRMPRFNLSPDDTQALVNYFAAVDRQENVGIGLKYPYVPMPQNEDAYLEQKTAEYVARLKARNQYEPRKKDLQASWEAELTAKQKAAEKALADAEERLKSAVEGAKPEATRVRDLAKKAADTARDKAQKKDISEFVKRWETREAYLADAARLVVHNDICLTCHNAGGVLGKENKGPNLENITDRLRPDWTQRWVTNPQRFLHYTSLMPINFTAKEAKYQDAFVGSSADQIEAVRDFLMLYPQKRDWPILRARPVLGSGAPAAAPAGGQ